MINGKALIQDNLLKFGQNSAALVGASNRMTVIQQGDLRDGINTGDLMSIHTSLEVWRVKQSQVNSLKFHLKKLKKKKKSYTNKQKSPKVIYKKEAIRLVTK